MGIKYALLTLVLIGGNAWAQTPADAYRNQYAQGRVLVEPRAGLAEAAFGKILEKYGSKARKLGKGKIQLVELPTDLSETEAVALLSKDPDLKFVELDRKVRTTFVPNDNYYSYQWHLPQIGLPTAWNTTQGLGVTIAILDSGVDASHADLAANLVPGFNVYDNNSNTLDVCGHGTAVAGAAAAATNNGLGVSGVAGQSKIMPVRVAYYDSVADGCFAYFSTIASGITYAADHGARVVNCSYASLASSAAVQSAGNYLKSKGGLLFSTAGNQGIDENITPTDSMVVVSATDSSDAKASWSSYGNFVTIAAPGEDILTTTSPNEYQYWTGTSFASPVAAGVAALMMSARPTLSPDVIEGLLYSTAVDLGVAGRDSFYGHGRVNAAAAVQAAVNYAAPGDTQSPTVSIASPAPGATVSGSVTVGMSASDNVGVTRVDLMINGTLYQSDSTAPYEISWNTTAYPDGNANLIAVAYDAAGNSKNSSPVTVTVSNPIPDTTPPTVAITSPTANATLAGVVNVTANASDNKGVVKVDIRVGANVVATSTIAPYSFSWDTKVIANGTYNLSAVAYDAAGNTKASAAVSVRVANDTTAPTVAITSPTANATVKESVTIKASASDNFGVVKVEFKVNGTLVGTDTASPFTFVWDSKSIVDGTVSLVAVAYDAAGNSKASTSVSVKVANTVLDTIAPTVSITSPGTNATVKESVTIKVKASDAVGVVKVEFKVNGALVGTSTAAPYSAVWDSKSVVNGTVSLTAVAYDAAGNSRISNAISVKVLNPGPDVTAPTVSVTGPIANATIKGLVTVKASASDNVGVVKVEFLVNGMLVGTDTASPFSVVWDSKSVPNGNVSFVAVAYDAAGNSKASTAVVANVVNPLPDTTAPVLNITNPLPGAVVTGIVSVTAKATDNSAISGTTITISIDGVVVASGKGGSRNYRWNTNGIAVGAHTIQAVATDAAGNTSITSVDVTK